MPGRANTSSAAASAFAANSSPSAAQRGIADRAAVAADFIVEPVERCAHRLGLR